jgi:hypothetical protein
MKTETLFSSANCEWETPPKLFKELDERFHFTLDVASTDQNALCKRHYTKEQNGLTYSWQTGGGVLYGAIVPTVRIKNHGYAKHGRNRRPDKQLYF